MDLDSIGAALRRKLGPLPVWIWAIAGGVVVYFLRSKGYFQGVLGGNVDQGTTLQPRQDSATPPQPVTSLQPGESVYDPNSGALTTAPGNDSGGVGAVPDQSQALEDLAAAIEGGFTTTVNVKQPAAKKPVKKKAKAKVKKSPKRKPKPKKAHTPSTHPTHKTTVPKKTRPRGSAKIRTHTGGRTTKKPAAKKPHAGKATTRQIRPAVTSRLRQRPTVPMVAAGAPVQHTQASHASRATATAHTPPPHRPSAPPPRTVRTPAPRHAPPPRKRAGR